MEKWEKTNAELQERGVTLYERIKSLNIHSIEKGEIQPLAQEVIKIIHAYEKMLKNAYNVSAKEQ